MRDREIKNANMYRRAHTRVRAIFWDGHTRTLVETKKEKMDEKLAEILFQSPFYIFLFHHALFMRVLAKQNSIQKSGETKNWESHIKATQFERCF